MKKNNSLVNLQFPISYRKFTIAHFIDRYCRSHVGRAARAAPRRRFIYVHPVIVKAKSGISLCPALQLNIIEVLIVNADKSRPFYGGNNGTQSNLQIKSFIKLAGRRRARR